MTKEDVRNLMFIDDSNKGFKKAIKKGNLKLAEAYLFNIMDCTIDLINQNEELECLGCKTIITHIDKNGYKTEITFSIYSEYRDFLCELDEMIESVTT